MKKSTEMTPETLKLFTTLAKDAGSWDGSPIVDITPAQRGNLTDLKARGLISTSKSDGTMFADFSDAGVALAASLGITINRGGIDEPQIMPKKTAEMWAAAAVEFLKL